MWKASGSCSAATPSDPVRNTCALHPQTPEVSCSVRGVELRQFCKRAPESNNQRATRHKELITLTFRPGADGVGPASRTVSAAIAAGRLFESGVRKTEWPASSPKRTASTEPARQKAIEGAKQPFAGRGLCSGSESAEGLGTVPRENCVRTAGFILQTRPAPDRHRSLPARSRTSASAGSAPQVRQNPPGLFRRPH
jgi:hypothetical protein